MKIKFYWNENYPEAIYCMAKDPVNGGDALYVLAEETEYLFESDEIGMSWKLCQWLTTKSAMERAGFQFIGSL